MIKGSHHTLEAKQKMDGRHHSKATKKNMSDIKKKQFQDGTFIPWNKGKKGIYSEETGRKHPMLGRHHSDATKQKIREKRVGRYAGENHPLWGTHRTIETKQKISQNRTGKYKGTCNPFYGKHHSKESIEKNREANKNKWRDEEYVKKMMEKFNAKPNGVELYLDFILQNRFPDEWKYVGDGNCVINGLLPDFINCNGKKKIIEVFGDYWHTKKKKMRYSYTEEGRKKAFNEVGYDTLIIWEHEFEDENKIIEKIRGFMDAGNQAD